MLGSNLQSTCLIGERRVVVPLGNFSPIGNKIGSKERLTEASGGIGSGEEWLRPHKGAASLTGFSALI